MFTSEEEAVLTSKVVSGKNMFNFFRMISWFAMRWFSLCMT